MRYIIKDGSDSGQMVDHVLIHIIPMHKKKYNQDNNNSEKIEIQARTLDDMEKEAEAYRQNLNMK